MSDGALTAKELFKKAFQVDPDSGEGKNIIKCLCNKLKESGKDPASALKEYILSHGSVEQEQ
jgi:hypothetical protein